MGAIDLFLDAARNYERTHQLVLFTLLSTTELSARLFGFAAKEIWLEPERGLFDIQIEGEQSAGYIEVKLNSHLGEDQLGRQAKFLREEDAAGLYVLLATSEFEWTPESIRDLSGGRGAMVSSEQLIGALGEELLELRNRPAEGELVRAYREHLVAQAATFANFAERQRRGREFFYPLYRELQNRMPGVGTRIYTRPNPGGGVCILNASDSWQEPVKVRGVGTELYYEVVDDRLCIKFHSNTKNPDRRRRIRDDVRAAIRRVLGSRLGLVDSGRLGAYMSACQVQHDFADPEKLNASASIYETVGKAMPAIRKALERP